MSIPSGRGVKILLTAAPASGKTTTLQRALDSKFIQSLSPVGILCNEIRLDGKRYGFEAKLSTGEVRQFMQKDGISEMNSFTARVGSYVVDVDVVDQFIVPELEKSFGGGSQLIYIDEIGRAQAKSDRFLSTVRRIFESDGNVLATIVLEDYDWNIEFKQHPRAIILQVDDENRNSLPKIITAIIQFSPYLDRLSEKMRNFMNTLLLNLLSRHQYNAAKKLFDCSLVYVLDSRIKPEIISAAPNRLYFTVFGKTNTHSVCYNVDSDICTCDCDLSKGLGQFSESGPEVCSHELSVRIWREIQTL
jgi:nucleoside-triphosphatase THEP1